MRRCYVDCSTWDTARAGARARSSLLGCLSRRRRLGDRLCSDSGGGPRDAEVWYAAVLVERLRKDGEGRD